MMLFQYFRFSGIPFVRSNKSNIYTFHINCFILHLKFSLLYSQGHGEVDILLIYDYEKYKISRHIFNLKPGRYTFAEHLW